MGEAFVGGLLGLKKLAEGVHEIYLDCHLIGLRYEQDLAGMPPATIARHT